MKKIHFFVFGIIFLNLLFLYPQSTYAHFPATDGDMTITLHIDPNDDPISGQQAYVYFLFRDETKRFQLAKCNCVIAISEEGKQLYQQRLLEKKNEQPSIWGTSIQFIFPTRDVYHIRILGSPLVSGAFQPFDLFWDFRVDSDGSAGIVQKESSDLPIILGATVLGTVFLAFMGWFIKKEIVDAEENSLTVSKGKNRIKNKTI